MSDDPSQEIPESAPASVHEALPERVNLDDLHALSHAELIEIARNRNLRSSPDRSRHQLILDLTQYYLGHRIPVYVTGILEMTAPYHGLLRWPQYNFAPCPEDIYVSSSLIQTHFLRPGMQVSGTLRPARPGKDKYIGLDTVVAVEGRPIADFTEPPVFEQLTALFPDRRIALESAKYNSISARAMDLVAPLGCGQRGLIIAPPRVGKTILLKEIARAMRAGSPKIRVIMLLVDERPEEVTDLKQGVDAEIFSSTFDENVMRHVQISELVSERAKRLVEFGQDVVILIDSLTRLSRGYNNVQPGRGGRIMSGGVDTKALVKPKKFFGAARNVEEGGSLTILASCLTETESRMDQVIFEEFKGTGNMELHLDRTIAEHRIFPAIHILNSGTRRDELLYHPQEWQRLQVIRKQLVALPPIEAMQILAKSLRVTKTNAELLLTGLRSL